MTINEWLEQHANYTTLSGGQQYKLNHDRLVCKDGYSLSVQASASHYCSPRNDTGPYSHVEVAYPDTKARLLGPYRNGGVYSCVPVEVVDALIAKHGGVAEG